MKTASPEGQLMLSIGALLASERERRGIAVERAAKETRMRPQRIRDMEGDDLSHFTNPSYARMFIIAYAKYLGIPMKTIHDHLPDRGESATEGYQYISTATEELPSLRHDIASKPARRGPLVYIIAAAAVTVVAACLGVAAYVVVMFPRLAPPSQPVAEATAERTPAPAPPAPAVPVPTPAVVALDNLQPDGTAANAFDGEVALQTTPAPAPAITIVKKPAPHVDDHTFLLLGSAPDPKSAGVQ